MWSYTHYSISLIFLICKMEMTVLPVHTFIDMIKRENTCKASPNNAWSILALFLFSFCSCYKSAHLVCLVGSSVVVEIVLDCESASLSFCLVPLKCYVWLSTSHLPSLDRDCLFWFCMTRYVDLRFSNVFQL